MTDDNDPRWKIPPIDPAFLAWLSARYPEKCPDPRDTERDIWIKVGARGVVVWLTQQLALQTKQ